MKERKEKQKKRLLHAAALWLGSCILAFGMYNIHSRCAITEGGVLGLTLLLQHWFHISPGITEFILDALCYALGLKLFGGTFLKNALFASLGFSVFYNVFAFFPPLLPNFSEYPLVACILGALFVGVGVGIVVREGGALGGDDVLALAISKVLRCKITLSYLVTDLTVLLLSLSYIPFGRIFYSLITVTLSSLLIGVIQNAGRQKSMQNEG